MTIGWQQARYIFDRQRVLVNLHHQKKFGVLDRSGEIPNYFIASQVFSCWLAGRWHLKKMQQISTHFPPCCSNLSKSEIIFFCHLALSLKCFKQEDAFGCSGRDARIQKLLQFSFGRAFILRHFAPKNTFWCNFPGAAPQQQEKLPRLHFETFCSNLLLSGNTCLKFSLWCPISWK